jgi:hypothetical protein
MTAGGQLPPIDEGMLTFYKKLTAASPPEAVEWPLPQQRKSWDEVCRSFAAARPEGLLIEEIAIERRDGSVPVRIYRWRRSIGIPHSPRIIWRCCGGCGRKVLGMASMPGRSLRRATAPGGR